MAWCDWLVKLCLILISIATCAFLCGCVAKREVALVPVGPAPRSSTLLPGGQGALVVYSARETVADFNARDPYRPEFSDYDILSASGQPLQRVHNNSGTIFQDPSTVLLTPGNYEVRARANGMGWIMVPVVIRENETTKLRLDRSLQEAGLDDSHAVRLPNGQIIGWKTTVN